MFEFIKLLATKDPTILLLIAFDLWGFYYGVKWAVRKMRHSLDKPIEPNWGKKFETTEDGDVVWVNYGKFEEDTRICDQCNGDTLTYYDLGGGGFWHCSACGQIIDSVTPR